jgi:hypothetical protein
MPHQCSGPCGKVRSGIWFQRSDGSSQQPCLICLAHFERVKGWNAKYVKSSARDPAAPKPWSKCTPERKCTVCFLIDNFRRREAQIKQTAEEEKLQRLKALPLSAVEKTRRENYKIKCSSCGERFDPNKEKIVGAICLNCCPEHEKEIFEELYKTWHCQKPKHRRHLARAM